MELSTPNRHAPDSEPGRGRLGANLKHLSGMHDISQRDLAEHLGLSVQGLWNILHGRSEPRLRTAERIATAFAIPLDSLCRHRRLPARRSPVVRAGAHSGRRNRR